MGQDTSEQKRTKRQIESAIRRSAKAEKGTDSYGGKGWGPGSRIAADRPKPSVNVSSDLASFSRWLVNAFCPTGVGGGVDPHCSPSGTHSSDAPVTPSEHLKLEVRGDLTEVVINPSGEQVKNWVSKLKGQYLRGMLVDGKIYVWQATGDSGITLEHKDVAQALKKPLPPFSDRFQVSPKGVIGTYDGPKEANPNILKWAERYSLTVNLAVLKGA